MAQALQWVVALTAAYILLPQGAGQTTDRYTDENRPYEFGFNIEGQQHRHEKKDEFGIIMGEFGFITADGIYHVTVYATDENGDFKIISMKNIRVGPSPWGTPSSKTTAPGFQPTAATQAPPSHPTAFARTPPSLPLTTTIQKYKTTNSPVYIQPTTSIATTKKTGSNGCGSCVIPTTTAKPPQPSSFPLPGPGVSTPKQSFNNQFPTTSSIFKPDVEGIPLTGSRQPKEHQPNFPPSPSTFQSPGNTQTSTKPPMLSAGKPSVVSNAKPTAELQPPFIPDQQPAFPNQFPSVHNTPQTITRASFPSTTPPTVNSFSNGIYNQPTQKTLGVNPHVPRDGSPPNPSIRAQTYNVPGSLSTTPAFNKPQGTPSIGSVSPQVSANTFRPPQSNPPSGISTTLPFFNSPGSISFNSPATSIPTPAPPQLPERKPPPLGVVQEGLPRGVSVKDIMDLLYRFNYTAAFHGHHESGYRNGDKTGGYFVNGRDGIGRQVKYIANEFGYQPNITLVDLGINSPDIPKEDTEKEFQLKGFEFVWFPRS